MEHSCFLFFINSLYYPYSRVCLVNLTSDVSGTKHTMLLVDFFNCSIVSFLYFCSFSLLAIFQHLYLILTAGLTYLNIWKVFWIFQTKSIIYTLPWLESMLWWHHFIYNVHALQMGVPSNFRALFIRHFVSVMY